MGCLDGRSEGREVDPVLGGLLGALEGLDVGFAEGKSVGYDVVGFGEGG